MAQVDDMASVISTHSPAGTETPAGPQYFHLRQWWPRRGGSRLVLVWLGWDRVVFSGVIRAGAGSCERAGRKRAWVWKERGELWRRRMRVKESAAEKTRLKKRKIVSKRLSKEMQYILNACNRVWRLKETLSAWRREGGRAELCWETQREPGVQGEVSGWLNLVWKATPTYTCFPQSNRPHGDDDIECQASEQED